MCDIFQDEDTEAGLEVDATNAPACLNRQSTLQNIQVLFPSFATMLITYREKTQNCLYSGGETDLSQEETTQGDHLTMVCMHGDPSSH